MARFYGSVQGNRGETHRLGTPNSGLLTIAASWEGSIRVRLWVNQDGEDCYTVYMAPWQGSGQEVRTIAEGRLKDG